MSLQRATTIVQHVAAGGLSTVACAESAPRDDDVVIVAAVRTPIGLSARGPFVNRAGRGRRGIFKDTPADDLLSTGACC